MIIKGTTAEQWFGTNKKDFFLTKEKDAVKLPKKKGRSMIKIIEEIEIKQDGDLIGVIFKDDEGFWCYQQIKMSLSMQAVELKQIHDKLIKLNNGS